MEPRENRYKSWTSERIGTLWGRLLLLVFPVTLVFLAIAVPLSVRAVRSDLRLREEEVLTAHGSLLAGLREETERISSSVLHQEHMSDTARQVVLDEMVRTVFRAVGEDGTILNDKGETVISAGDLPVQDLPEEEGRTAGEVFFLSGNKIQKRMTEETRDVLYRAVTPFTLDSRQYVLVTGQDFRQTYESAELTGAKCRLIYEIILAVILAGGLAGTVLLFVQGRRRKRKSGGTRREKINRKLGLVLFGVMCLAVLAGLFVPSLAASMARSGIRKPRELKEEELPVSQELLAAVPDGEEIIESLTTRAYTEEDFHLEPYRSSEDCDGDGIDDQTDILESALAYVAKKPAYVSEYYMTGYPTENKGVCTDVIAFGFLGAGYDLMHMVWEDVLMNPAYYPNSTDENIDFRRVENDLSYFSRNAAESLTTDIYDIDAWRAGDIVVFEKHIGFVARERNYKGVPYLLHHGYEGQTEYVEDHLEENQDLIVAHFRWR